MFGLLAKNFDDVLESVLSSIEETLSKVQGVSKATVNLEKAEVIIEMEEHIPIETFQEALKKGKKMTISFFDNEFDPNEGEDILKLNRSIDFKLNNSELLDEKSGCKTD